MRFLPPPFFEYDIKLNKTEKGKVIPGTPIPFKSMSSGEKQFIYAVSTLIYHIKNLLSIEQSDRVKYRHINLILDEVELCFHPEYQRLFINKLINTIKRIDLIADCDFNIIMATHSPFILSDIPKCNVLFLKEGKQCDEMQEDTFGANIHSLLQNAFFLNNGEIDENLYTEIKLVSEPFIRSQLLKLYKELAPCEATNKEIKTLKDKIEKLEKQINDKDKN
ncbi:putative ATP-binding protein involved in virulence [Bacteroidales bacterium Barb4]|nr:putative ATP-binding protein involved in virulence [Bacteroidales bacterium Barb4]